MPQLWELNLSFCLTISHNRADYQSQFERHYRYFLLDQKFYCVRLSVFPIPCELPLLSPRKQVISFSDLSTANSNNQNNRQFGARSQINKSFRQQKNIWLRIKIMNLFDIVKNKITKPIFFHFIFGIANSLTVALIVTTQSFEKSRSSCHYYWAQFSYPSLEWLGLQK